MRVAGFDQDVARQGPPAYAQLNLLTHEASRVAQGRGAAVTREQLLLVVVGVGSLVLVLALVGVLRRRRRGTRAPRILDPHERLKAALAKTRGDGVGLEKKEQMPLVCSEDDMAAMVLVRDAFAPDNRLNPGKIFPDGKKHTPHTQPVYPGMPA